MVFIRLHYFLAFAVMGSQLPYLAVFLQDVKHLSRQQIGYVFAAVSVAVMLTPVLISFLADAHVQPRKLLASICIISAVQLALTTVVEGFWLILLVYASQAFVWAPTFAIQDGLNFAEQQRLKRSGLPQSPYHQTRAWGTVGFIAPSVALYFILQAGVDTTATMITAAVMSFAGAINAFMLPRVTRDETTASKAPTLAALRAISQRQVLIFCIAMWLVHFASGLYYGFTPIYLKDELGLAEKWLGVIPNLGVFGEFFFMLAFGFLSMRFGLRWLMIIGVTCIAVRLALLAFAPTVETAVITQVFHGMQVLILHVAPPIFLNSHARDNFRASIQGVYAMLVMGSARFTSGMIGGAIAEHSVIDVMAVGACTAAVAALLMITLFYPDRKNRDADIVED